MFMTNGSPGSAGASLSKLVASLGDPLGRRVLRHCDQAQEPVSPRQLAEALDAPRTQVERHLALLVQGEALRAVHPGGAQAGELYASALDEGAGWIRGVLETSREVDEKDGEA